jgi:tellurite methyltransferase
MNNKLTRQFGQIDIYLFDQLLKGRYDECKKILDVGCGTGRNLHYFLQNGFEVYGIDRDADAVKSVKELCCQLASFSSPQNFTVAAAEDMPFERESFDLVICSAVLHFAENKLHFDNMMRSIWRILKPGGFLFARLASSIGIEKRVRKTGADLYCLPDGTIRFLVDEETLLQYTASLGGELYEPIKTTNVQNQRCMTTWCVQKIRIE